MRVPSDNLSDPIFHHAQARPASIAVIDGCDRLDFRAFAALIAKASVYLCDLGIAEGDRIGIALTNSADHVILMFAVARSGATLVELSIDDDAEALAATARKYAIGTIFTEAHAPAIDGVRQIPVGLFWRREIEGKSGDHRSATPGDKLYILMLSTGSTGIPSAWMLTHRNFCRVLEMREAWFLSRGWDAGREHAHFLLANPLRFVWFQILVGLQVRAGGTLVIVPEFIRPPDMLRAFAAWENAVSYITANTCRYFLRAAPPRAFLLPNFRWLESGGLVFAGDEKRAMAAHVTENYYECYGSTGGGLITGLSAPEMATKADTVGRPAEGMTIEIVDGAGRVLPPGEIGEVRCRPLWALRLDTEMVSRGTERVENGWCYPADIGLLDEDGYLYLKGRTADLIRREGTDIFAPEIEAVIASHPAVAEAAVIALPSTTRGQEIIAFVVKHGAIDHDELGRFCRARLAPERLPDRVYYTDAIPRIAGQKPDRLRLQALAAAETARNSG
jgi:acyl-coenzyme A synthetase/AMP-(fatty) acid ligase